MITQADRDLYCLESSGFIVLPDFVPADTLDTIARHALEFEEEVGRFVQAGGTAILQHSWPLRTTRCLYAVSSEVQDLILHPTVQTFAQRYLGKAVTRDCLIQTIMPDPRNQRRGEDADVSFHRDALWPDESFRPMYLHAFVLLHDCTRQNGATIVVPGSHRQREPGYYFKLTDPHGPQDGIDYRVYQRRYFPSGIHLEAPRGSLIVLDPMTIHTQGNNVTSTRRSLLNMTFRSADVTGRPPLLNARTIAERFARVPMQPEVLDLLESDPSLPAHFGPLGNPWPGHGPA